MAGFANFKIGGGEVATTASTATANGNNGAYGGVGGVVQKGKDIRRSRVWRRAVTEVAAAQVNEEEDLVDADILFA